MIRIVAIGVALLIAAPGLAGAQGNDRNSGQYVLTQPRHNAKVKKVDSFSVKQASPRAFNPKEFKLDEKAPWKKAPKTKTLCATPGGKPRAC